MFGCTMEIRCLREVKNTTDYIEAFTLPTRQEAAAAQRVCCGRVCRLCESPAEYAWRRRTVDLAWLVRDAVEEDLSDAEREAVVKYWFENKTLKRTAEELGKAPPNVLRTLDRATAKLHTLLKHTVKYQHNLARADALTPLAVNRALGYAALAGRRGESIGERLRLLRLRQNLPKSKAAEAAGLSPARLTALENDKSLPGAEETILLAALYQTTTDCVLKGEDE